MSPGATRNYENGVPQWRGFATGPRPNPYVCHPERAAEGSAVAFPTVSPDTVRLCALPEEQGLQTRAVQARNLLDAGPPARWCSKPQSAAAEALMDALGPEPQLRGRNILAAP